MTEVDQDTKVCPRCAERIKSAALVCRFCGYDYAPSRSPEPTFSSGNSTGTNGYAIASLVLGIVWMFGLGSILAVIFGFMARRQIDESGGRQGGGGLAVAGIVLGFVGIAGLLLWLMAACSAASQMHQQYP